MSDLAWFDGAAIYLAVLIVSGFSAIVDWRKEREFVLRAQEERDGKLVSTMKKWRVSSTDRRYDFRDFLMHNPNYLSFQIRLMSCATSN